MSLAETSNEVGLNLLPLPLAERWRRLILLCGSRKGPLGAKASYLTAIEAGERIC